MALTTEWSVYELKIEDLLKNMSILDILKSLISYALRQEAVPSHIAPPSSVNVDIDPV